VAAIFEAEPGWVPVNTSGTVWRYRARGSSGVIVFKRASESEGGARSYEATHLDRFSNDETITTDKRRAAVRFAVTGTTRKPRAAQPEGS
jgi:hypothetical protein